MCFCLTPWTVTAASLKKLCEGKGPKVESIPVFSTN